VLVLAVLVVFATAGPGSPPGPADTSVCVPGTSLRFGLADSLVAARGFTRAGSDGREGSCRFFGIPGKARLGFADGRLARAEFTAVETAPHQRGYVQDQLSAMGYRRRCSRLRPTSSDCEWTGRTRVHLKVDQAQLTAVVTPPEPVAPADPGAAVRAAPADTGPRAAAGGPDGAGTLRSVPVLPETLGVSAPGRPGRRAEAVVRDAPRCLPPPGPRAAGIVGRVWVLALVDVDGRVLEAAVTRGIPTLDAAALECVRRWRFEPRTWQGAPCRFRVEVPVTVTFD
jgi:TonB family protein